MIEYFYYLEFHILFFLYFHFQDIYKNDFQINGKIDLYYFLHFLTHYHNYHKN